MKIPRLPKSTLSHYAAIAKAEGIAIELMIEGFRLRIVPFDAEIEARLGTKNGETEQLPSGGLKPW